MIIGALQNETGAREPISHINREAMLNDHNVDDDDEIDGRFLSQESAFDVEDEEATSSTNKKVAQDDETSLSIAGNAKNQMRGSVNEEIVSSSATLSEARKQEDLLAAAYIQQLDMARAEMVARRREYTNPVQRIFAQIIPYGGLLSCGLNLAGCCIGAGIISLPSAFMMSGLAMGLVYMIVISLLTVYSYTIMGIVGRRTGLRNYEQIVLTLMGPWADYLLIFCIWFLSFGAIVSYVISMHDALRAFIGNADSAPSYLQTNSGTRVLTVIVWIVFMWPLSLLKEINSLRYFAFVAISFIVFFVICMVIHSTQHGMKHGRSGKVVYFQTGNNAIQGLSIFMFSFGSQLNCYKVFGEMHKPTARRLTVGSGVGVGLAFVLYLFAGLFGYLDFGDKVIGSSLNLYNPIKEPLMGVAYVGLMIKLCVGYGLMSIPVRDTIYHVVHLEAQRLSWWKNAVFCSIIAVCSLLAGLFIPRVNLVFGLIGGFSAGFTGFVYPALMYMYSGNWTVKSVGLGNYLGTYFLLIVGVIGIIFGTGAAIYGEVMAEHGG